MREQRKETEKKWGIGRKEHNNPQACETVHLFDQALCLVTSLSCLLTKYFLRCICVCKLTLLVRLVWMDSVPVTRDRLRCLGALGLCCQLLNKVEVLTPDNSVETNKQNKQTNNKKQQQKSYWNRSIWREKSSVLMAGAGPQVITHVPGSSCWSALVYLFFPNLLCTGSACVSVPLWSALLMTESANLQLHHTTDPGNWDTGFGFSSHELLEVATKTPNIL